MTPQAYYSRALDMCINAYASDLTPASWRMPERDLPLVIRARDLVGNLIAADVDGRERTMMGLPVEILPHDSKPSATLTLMCVQPGGPPVTIP